MIQIASGASNPTASCKDQALCAVVWQAIATASCAETLPQCSQAGSTADTSREVYAIPPISDPPPYSAGCPTAPTQPGSAAGQARTACSQHCAGWPRFISHGTNATSSLCCCWCSCLASHAAAHDGVLSWTAHTVASQALIRYSILVTASEELPLPLPLSSVSLAQAA